MVVERERPSLLVPPHTEGRPACVRRRGAAAPGPRICKGRGAAGRGAEINGLADQRARPRGAGAAPRARTHRGRTSVRQTKSNPSGTKERIIFTQVLLQSQQATLKPFSHSDTKALWGTGCPGNAKRCYQKTKEGREEEEDEEKKKVDMENADCAVGLD